MKLILLSTTIIFLYAWYVFAKKKHSCAAGNKWKNSCLFCECTEEGVERCSFKLNNDTPKTPLILKNKNDPELLYPDEYNLVHVSKDKKFKITCLDKRFSKLSKKTVVAQCIDDGMVLIHGGRKVKLSDLECDKFPTSTLHKTNETCQGDNVIYEVGFEINKNFLKTMSICFDENEEKPLYSRYGPSKIHTGHQTNVVRPQFVHDNLYGFNVNKAYFNKEQKKTFAKILKSDELAEKYIRKPETLHYLARGHLTPKADFVYGSEQATSFHFANVAPQWQVFNEGNWNQLEANVRKLLIKYPYRYEILTGTYGVATLPDINNEQQQLYLHVDESEKKLPVPKFFWKVVYDTETKAGVAIVGVNNPYLEDIPSDYVICKDICESVDWLSLDISKVNKGYLYCCEMDEFFKATGYKNVFISESEETKAATNASKEISPEEESNNDSKINETIASKNQSDYSIEISVKYHHLVELLSKFVKSLNFHPFKRSKKRQLLLPISHLLNS